MTRRQFNRDYCIDNPRRLRAKVKRGIRTCHKWRRPRMRQYRHRTTQHSQIIKKWPAARWMIVIEGIDWHKFDSVPAFGLEYSDIGAPPSFTLTARNPILR